MLFAKEHDVLDLNEDNLILKGGAKTSLLHLLIFNTIKNICLSLGIGFNRWIKKNLSPVYLVDCAMNHHHHHNL